MQPADSPDLPLMTMETDDFAVDPFPHFTAARAAHPWLARWALGYVVTDYRAMLDFFHMEEKTRPQFDDIVRLMDAEGTPWGRFQQSHMLGKSGEALSTDPVRTGSPLGSGARSTYRALARSAPTVASLRSI